MTSIVKIERPITGLMNMTANIGKGVSYRIGL